jgi:hypothetical protein
LSGDREKYYFMHDSPLVIYFINQCIINKQSKKKKKDNYTHLSNSGNRERERRKRFEWDYCGRGMDFCFILSFVNV